MSRPDSAAVVVDTMVMSALVNEARDPTRADSYRQLVAGRPVLISFATVTELRYGALKAEWGDLRRRGLERDLARVVIVQPDDELMLACARLRIESERAGHPLGQKLHEADRWIASTAQRLHLDLVSDDSVFVGVHNLTVLSRLA